MKRPCFFIKTMEKNNTLLIILLTLLAAIIIFFAGRWTKRPQTIEVEVVTTDTLVVRDTVRIDRPVYIAQRIVDTLRIPVTETVTVHDTTFISLPREQKEYADTTYHAWVSGYQPELDSIVVTQLTKYVTTTVTVPQKKKHWGIGATAGYGGAVDVHSGKVIFSPYVGFGLTYMFLSF